VVLRRGKSLVTLLAALTCAACGGPSPGLDGSDGAVDARHAQWDCPASWVPYARGGCGPAVLVCVPDGGASRGACVGVDLLQREDIVEDGGYVGARFHRNARGEIAGAWPAADFAPTMGDVSRESPTVIPGVPACPTGWQPTTAMGCEPRLRTDCPAGSAPLPGGDCTATDDGQCGASEWPALPATWPPAMYVREASDDLTADGTQSRPYGTLRAALARNSGELTLVIAAGRYDAQLALDRNVNVLGRCATRVRLHADGTEPAVRVYGAGHATHVRGVSIDGEGVGVMAEDGARATVSRVMVQRATGRGLVARGTASRLDATDVVVEDTQIDTVLSVGRGMQSFAGGFARAVRSVFRRNRETGVVAIGVGSVSEIEDCLVEQTRINGANIGDGIDAADLATTRAVRVVTRGNDRSAVFATLGAAVEIRDSLIEGAIGSTALPRQGGVWVQSGARAEVTSSTMRQLLDTAAVVLGPSSRLVLNRVSISDVRRNGPDAGHEALGAGSGGRVEATLVRLDRTGAGVRVTGRIDGMQPGSARIVRSEIVGCGAGLAAIGAEARIDVDDVLIHDLVVNADSYGQHGQGMQVEGGGWIDASRLRIERPITAGVVVVDSPSRATLRDVWIRDVRESPTHALGRALVAANGGDIEATRARLERSRGAAVFGYGPRSRISLVDVLVIDTEPDPAGNLGVGIMAELGALLDVRRTRILRSATAGVSVHRDATIQLRDVAVESTRVEPSDGWYGRGIEAALGGNLEATRVYLRDNLDVGIFALHAGGSVTLTDAIVDGVRPTSRGFGLGIAAYGGAAIDANRVAVVDASGGALVAGNVKAVGGARIHGRDAFVLNTRTSTIQFVPVGGRPQPFGRSVAYGVHVASGCRADVTHGVFDGGGHGFVVFGGELSLRDALVTRQLDALGAVADLATPTSLVLEGVVGVENANDTVVTASGLPAASALAPPTEVCMGAACL